MLASSSLSPVSLHWASRHLPGHYQNIKSTKPSLKVNQRTFRLKYVNVKPWQLPLS